MSGRGHCAHFGDSACIPFSWHSLKCIPEHLWLHAVYKGKLNCRVEQLKSQNELTFCFLQDNWLMTVVIVLSNISEVQAFVFKVHNRWSNFILLPHHQLA